MQNARLLIHKAFKKGRIDSRIYGSFVEHMGRVVYSGIYEPGHPQADEDGLRQDVLAAIKGAGISTIRYPGGNFVSGYDWRDGVGPKEQRPTRLDLAWKAMETNQFGTEEFMRFLKKTGSLPMMAVNLGLSGTKEALQYLEYCNFPGGTQYSDWRRENGAEQPYGIKLWCLGNEMDGAWQLGHKSASEYGRIARETAKAMKSLDPDIELVCCGSSLNSMATFPQWEADVLDETYEYADYISLHQYFDGHEKPFASFLAQADEMNQYIQNVGAVCEYIRTKKHSDKKMMISFDEWGVWTHHSAETNRECSEQPWQQAPPISEMIYSFQDALLFGGMLMALLKNADRVKVACQSLLVNVSSMIMTERGGEMWLQPIYHPFAQAAKYGHGVVMDSRLQCDYAEEEGNAVPLVDTVAIENEQQLVVFAINRNEQEEVALEIVSEGYHLAGLETHLVLSHTDLQATNQNDHHNIEPEAQKDCQILENKITLKLRAASWNVIVLKTV